MEPSQELIDQLYRERVDRARAMPPEEKLFLGLRLYDRSCRIMADGIRDEFPDAAEDRVQVILRDRLAMIRRLEQTPWQTQ
jgi:hypothetical protein